MESKSKIPTRPPQKYPVQQREKAWSVALDVSFLFLLVLAPQAFSRITHSQNWRNRLIGRVGCCRKPSLGKSCAGQQPPNGAVMISMLNSHVTLYGLFLFLGELYGWTAEQGKIVSVTPLESSVYYNSRTHEMLKCDHSNYPFRWV